MADPAVPSLTVAGGQARQQALRDHLHTLGLDRALILDRRHVHYFTGYWCRAVFASAAIIEREGPTILVVPYSCRYLVAADQVMEYPSNHLGTLIDDPLGAILEVLGPHFARSGRWGCDGQCHPGGVGLGFTDIQKGLFQLRRAKYPDELALIRHAIRATEAAYAHAFEHLRAGITEVELFAGMQAAATQFAGEVIGEFGNDFQIGDTGSAPRRRAAGVGEMAIFDLSVVLRGYRSDMCRSFVVGREPSPEQQEAHTRILEVLTQCESEIRGGGSCRELYNMAREQLDGYQGWTFKHHLGHGIGLSAHEAPRLNPHWEDTFQIGDVFAVEPGLYGQALRGGLRVEQIYHLGANGLERLTHFPTKLGETAVERVMKLAGKKALVTGAARGIGKGCAVELARAGADVAINDREHSAETEAVAAEIQALGRQAVIVEGDVFERASCEKVMERALSGLGHLDILISNPAFSRRGDFLTYDPELFDRVLQGTLTGGFHMSQLAARHMVSRRQGGKIVFISSVHARIPFARSVAYNAGKSGLKHMAFTIAAELLPHRINVNVIEPGWIDTPGEHATFGTQAIAEAAPSLPWGRLGTPSDIGRAVVFLASDDADYITGTSLLVDGGLWLRAATEGAVDTDVARTKSADSR